jgi:hypothetical protein
MRTLIRLLIATLSFVAFSASAEVMQYTLCTLKDGKSINDVKAWVDEWRPLVKAAGKKYEIRILLPHASTEKLNQFFIEGSSPTLTTYAEGWEWWYSDPKALKSNERLVSVAACEANSVYRTLD